MQCRTFLGGMDLDVRVHRPTRTPKKLQQKVLAFKTPLASTTTGLAPPNKGISNIGMVWETLTARAPLLELNGELRVIVAIHLRTLFRLLRHIRARLQQLPCSATPLTM